MPPDACGGAQFVLAVCPPNVEASRAAQDSSSLVLRFQSEAEVLLCTAPHITLHGLVVGCLIQGLRLGLVSSSPLRIQLGRLSEPPQQCQAGGA